MKTFRRLIGDQRGFTLLELLVAIPIAALVVGGATAALIPLLNSKDASTHMLSIRQVQTAGYWVSTDGIQASEEPEIIGDGIDDPFELIFVWVDPKDEADLYDDEEIHVRYRLVESSNGWDLERTRTVKDRATGDTKYMTTSVVARYITRATIEPPGDGEVAYVFTVAAQVGREPEKERTYEIGPRMVG